MSTDVTLLKIAERALEMVRDNTVIGLGSGRAATLFVKELGARVQKGLKVAGVPTSQATADLAASLGVPLKTLAEVEELDIAFDGADEVDPQLDLIKGYGGALVREKIVAASARQFVILVGAEKLVPALGSGPRGELPVEVVPFGVDLCRRRLDALGLSCHVRPKDKDTPGVPFVTDNGNYTLDCKIGAVVGGTAGAAALEQSILAIPGVVDTGLFLGMAHLVLCQEGDTVRELRRG